VKKPFALGDTQLKIIMRAASTLPPERRDQFLRDLAARLGDQPSPLAVEAAINTALTCVPVFLCDSASTPKEPPS
jgi:hypothetical protein